MKPTSPFGIGAMALSAVLPATLGLAGLLGHAQSNGLATPNGAGSHHHHYQLIDLGTFGGPNSILPGAIESINPSGTVTGAADTSFLDPDFAIQNSYFSDPYIERSYIWKDGHRTALPALRGGRNTGPQWIKASASIVGASENGQIDPSTGIKEIRAVLWDPEHAFTTSGRWGEMAASHGSLMTRVRSLAIR
jgi:hypothetical protein